MRYGVLGATGPTGLEILKLLAGRDVSVYVRSPEKLPQGMQLKVTQGHLNERKKLTAWAEKFDVILNALGHKAIGAQLKANLGLGTYPDPNLITDAMTAVIEAKPKKIIDCSAYGTRETRGDLPFVFGKIFLPLLIKQSYADHEQNESLLEKSGIPFVIARPGMLTNGPLTSTYRAQARFTAGKTMKISRADVAHFMVRAADGNEFANQCVGLGY